MDFLGGLVVKNMPDDIRELGFNHWVRKIPWRRKWQPSPVFLPRISHGQRNLVCYSHAFQETNSLRRTMQIVQCSLLHRRSKAESPLSQGPRPAFVKIFYTPCVRVQTHHPNSLETYINKGRVNTATITPSFMCYVFKSQ